MMRKPYLYIYATQLFLEKPPDNNCLRKLLAKPGSFQRRVSLEPVIELLLPSPSNLVLSAHGSPA
jgi:hypothetical protein